MANTILSPVDYSEASQEALGHAVSLARTMNAKLLAVHVELPSVPPLGAAESPAERRQQEQAEVRSQLDQMCADGEPQIDHEFRVLHGDPTAEIVRLATDEQVDLIVMATSGRSGWRRMLMGSVAESVMRDAPCPVLTCRSADRVTESEAGATSEDDIDQEIDFREAPADRIARRGSRAIDLLAQAIRSRATDVHLDPLGDGVEIRFRIDGRLEHYCRLPHGAAHPVATQLKLMAEVEIADPFTPREGRFGLPAPLHYDVRLTRVPVVGGESIALRLLNRETLLRPLDTLGMSADSLDLLKRMLRLGEGVVLITGPAGSGKTTTAYSMAHAMDDGHRNIVTIEDPVEYRVPSFRQMSVDARHGITMTSGLRSILRMDPDVVLVGEIRDAEAAEIAMRAASSGKYVFSTIHTRDVASTVTALRDLHIDNRSLAGNLTGIISQRLVRRACDQCHRTEPISERMSQFMRDEGVEPSDSVAAPSGCQKCRNTGYYERVGVFEAVLPDREIREAIQRGEGEDDLRDMLRARGTRSLLAESLTKVRDGISTFDEVRSMTWVTFPE
jgi:type IV pilus assembly protein PilB